MSLLKHICNGVMLHNFARFWLRKRTNHFLLRRQFDFIWLLVGCGGHPHGSSNWPIQITWRESRIGRWRGPHEAREAQGVIRSEQLSFWIDSYTLQSNLLGCSLYCFAESTGCLATNLSSGRFNLYFGGPSVPALERQFHKYFRSSGSVLQHYHSTTTGSACFWPAGEYAGGVWSYQ